MSLGEFEPEVWIAATHPAACRETISLGELAGMTVIHGPRRAEPVTYDAWTRVLRATDPRLDFTTRRSGTRCRSRWPSPPPATGPPRS